MTSPARKPRKGDEVVVARQPWTFDPAVMVYVESTVDGHRILADRNCVATCRRLADLIPPLIPPPPPPVDPKVAKAAAASAKKSSANPAGATTTTSSGGGGGGADGNNDLLHPGTLQANRGPSAVSPLFEEDLGSEKPTTSEQAIFGKHNINHQQGINVTPVIPVIKIDCLDGRQLEAAMRLAYFKYMSDQIMEGEKRKTISMEQLGLSADELLAIGTILGC